MVAKHLMPGPTGKRPIVGSPTLFRATWLAAVVPVSVLCATGVAASALDAIESGRSADAVTVVDGGPGAPEPVSQEGTLIAVSADSVTARSADGYTRTYRVTPYTTLIIGQGRHSVSAVAHFAVNEQVAIVGTTIRGGTAFATAVADRDFGHGDGPPMDNADGT